MSFDVDLVDVISCVAKREVEIYVGLKFTSRYWFGA